MAEPSPPPELLALAERRAAARTVRDFAAADALRAEIAAAGWLIRDGAGGYSLAPAPAYDVLPSVRDLPDLTGQPPTRRTGVALLVEGWPDDLRDCLDALLEHVPPEVGITALDVGNVDAAGAALHELAGGHPGRVQAWHVEAPVGWGAARGALLRAETAEVQVWLDTSTILTGDALGPLLAALDDDTVVGAGWRGVDVDLEDDWRSFRAAGPGEVDALLGYLLAVRTSAALAAGGPHPKARFYRNADLEFSLALRAAGGRLVVPEGRLPLRQARHRGYYDSDPDYRDRESRRTYQRLLGRFRGHPEILAPRP